MVRRMAKMATGSGIRVVQDFLGALEALELERALGMLGDDIVYQNVPLPPDRGRAQVERTLRLFTRFANHFEVRMHHIAERDGVVLTERTDVIRGPGLDLEFWCCGTFEVRDGKIVVWRDRFDTAAVTAQLLTSPLRKLARGLGVIGGEREPARERAPRAKSAERPASA